MMAGTRDHEPRVDLGLGKGNRSLLRGRSHPMHCPCSNTGNDLESPLKDIHGGTQPMVDSVHSSQTKTTLFHFPPASRFTFPENPTLLQVQRQHPHIHQIHHSLGRQGEDERARVVRSPGRIRFQARGLTTLPGPQLPL